MTKWNCNHIMNRAQIREYDRLAMEELGITGAVLMENAGRGAAHMAMEMADGNRVGIITGPGNNGGDGFVVARHLTNRGLRVTCYTAFPGDELSGDALTNYRIFKRQGGTIVDISTTAGLSGAPLKWAHEQLLVDALLGTGVTRQVEGHLAAVIEKLNQAPSPILSLDIPSGLDCDLGSPWGVAVKATATATFGHYKTGLLLYPGAQLAGRVKVIPIEAPPEISQQAGITATLLGEHELRPQWPKCRQDSHKGLQGHLMVVAGSQGKSGAAVMTSKAAMRTGVGLCTIATTRNAQPSIESRCTEVMVETVIEKPDAALTEKDMTKLAALLDGKTAVALGPGLTTARGIGTLAIRLLQQLEIPAVVDADGINILASDPSAAGRIRAPLVFTPHPGEMARLTGKTALEVQADRIRITREAATWHKATIVLKGAHTVIASPAGDVFINPTGNPGMATGGAGDVLTGIIGALLARGLDPVLAARLGTYVHGLAADQRVERTGFSGLLASDIIDELPFVLRNWEK